MGTSVSLANMIADVRARGEFRSGYIDDTTLTRWINSSLASLWDLMIEGGAESVPITVDSSTVTIASGTPNYALPSDFYHMLRVDVQDGDEWVKLDRFAIEDQDERATTGSDARSARYSLRGGYIWFSPDPLYAATVRLTYIASAPTLDAVTVTAFDSRNVWTEYVILDCLIKCGSAEENEMVGVWMKERDRCAARILGNAQPNQGEAPQVYSVTGRNFYDARDMLRRNR